MARHSAYSWGFLRLFVWLKTEVCAPFTAILRGIRVESDAFLSRIWVGFEPRLLPAWQVGIMHLTERLAELCIRVRITTFPGNWPGHFSSVPHSAACPGKLSVRSCQKSGVGDRLRVSGTDFLKFPQFPTCCVRMNMLGAIHVFIRGSISVSRLNHWVCSQVAAASRR